MVKVIDPTPQHPVVKRIACSNCGVLLEYVPRDVKEVHGRDYSGSADGYSYVKCPNCNGKAIINSW